MNSGSNMLNPFGRKAICIILVLLMCISFSSGSAAANSCEGGVDCPVCAERPHGHVPGAAASMDNPDCPLGGENNTCGIEAKQVPDEFQGIVSSIRSYHQLYNGIFATVLDEYGYTFLSKEFASQFLFSDSKGKTPIYFLNQTLLC